MHVAIVYYEQFALQGPPLVSNPPLVLSHARATFSEEKSNNFFLSRVSVDLRDPTTVPLNFTKSINLALSERGINSIQEAHRSGLIDNVLRETIPMYGRMIHGRDNGALWEAAQAYDVHGRVCTYA